MNDILARRARRATAGIALSAALVAGIAPATAIAAETSSPTAAVALQTEDAAAAKEKAYAAMQEALKNLEAAKDAASPEKIAEIDTKIAIFQKNYDTNLARAAIYKESLPTMQADTSNSKQANTTAGKLANTGDTTPSAIALAGIAAAGLGIATTAARRLKNSK